MLPSGNDAALVLAAWGGKLASKSNNSNSSIDLNSNIINNNNNVIDT